LSEHITSATAHDGAVAVLRFARPAKRNAITVAMYEALTAALHAAIADEAVRAVVFLGADGVFTAGNDLKDFMANPPTGEDSAVFRLLQALVDCPKPLVAGVDGPAVGIGTTMLLHCDLVVASDRARFQMPFVKLGLVPEGASSVLLPGRVGMQRASEWLLLGEPFSAQEAHAAGLVNAVVAPAEVDARAMAYAAALADRPPEAVRLAKALLRDPQRAQVHEALAREGAVFIERLQAPEAHAAFMTFFARK
jgi:enoyl-CoA hydratase/carnithine racemase